MNEEKDFVDGMIVKRPHENRPAFVKATISIKLDSFKGWVGGFVKANPGDEWINIDIKESQNGKLYAERNTYRPEKKQAAPDPKPEPEPEPEPAKETDDFPW